MNSRDVFHNPIWRGEDLGAPIPDSLHAVSMALPRWTDVIGYEEKRPAVMEKLRTGYPRFVIHPLVQEVAQRLGGDRPCLPLPSLKVAQRCVEFIRRRSGEAAQIVPGNTVFGVVTTEAGYLELRAFWQHTGWIVSTRQAEAELAGQRSSPEAPAVRDSLRRQLAAWYDCDPDDIFLTPTGMAAQDAALSLVTARRPQRPTVQLGFPYVDTLKLQQKFGAGVTLLHDLAHLERDLRELLARGPVAACFSEMPGNPLLGSGDVRQLSPIMRQHGAALVADDVVATPFNVDFSPYADLIASSLTKFIVGTGDVMGGALVCNPRSPFYSEFKALARARHEELLWDTDARRIDAQARTFPERMKRHNANGLLIAERLRAHEGVERVWYPKWEFNGAYEAVRRPQGGYGSLVTFLPKNAETSSPHIYDHLALCKGPSLGTSFTLLCPFTMLAHYTELDWAESCGVSRHLLRISVGLEDPEDLWQRLDRALRVA